MRAFRDSPGRLNGCLRDVLFAGAEAKAGLAGVGGPDWLGEAWSHLWLDGTAKLIGALAKIILIDPGRNGRIRLGRVAVLRLPGEGTASRVAIQPWAIGVLLEWLEQRGIGRIDLRRNRNGQQQKE
jgi:hypothetical protein